MKHKKSKLKATTTVAGSNRRANNISAASYSQRTILALAWTAYNHSPIDLGSEFGSLELGVGCTNLWYHHGNLPKSCNRRTE